ncbi:MAG: hypothetical protein KJ749_08935 [Planctomycetes bacterium]|nr:hypothetical protein [Planctomycetota bacterium]
MAARVLIVAGLFGLLAAAAPGRAGDTLETVEKRLLKQSQQVTALTAKVSMESRMDSSVASGKGRSSGTFACRRKGEKLLVYTQFESTMEMANPSDGKPKEVILSVTRIDDGEFTYRLVDRQGQQQATKTKAANTLGPLPEMVFKFLHQHHRLKVLPEDSIDGQPAVVIEGTPKVSAPGRGKVMSFFSKDTGIVQKMQTYDDKGGIVATIRYTDIELNPKIDPERFVFKVPAGVEVTDQTDSP